MSRLTELKELLSVSLHQDWDEELVDPADALLHVMSGYSADELATIHKELRELLRDQDNITTETFNDLGCEYDPTADGVSIKQWLFDLGTLIEREQMSRETS